MNVYPKIIHHGAGDGVTGSCHELRMSENAGILIDCGLFQGSDASGPLNQPQTPSPQPQNLIPFPVSHLKALVVTHVHLDHVGRIPYLLAAGFSGPILCSEPSALLLPLMLEDALKVGVTRDRRLIETALEVIGERIVPIPYGLWHAIGEGSESDIAVRLNPAGHILGSAWVQVKAGSSQVLFSGDLGAPWAPLLPAPKCPWGADLVVLEATYGDRLHEGRRERRKRLQAVIEKALSDGGTILVPAFALGRTQELLYEIEEILHRNQKRFAARGLPWEDLEIVLDSPLATRFTEAYRQLRPHWDAEARGRFSAGRRPLCFEQLTTVESHDDHLHAVRHLARTGRPCLVIAGSGMCTGGRIVNYLKALLGDPRTDILFVGYQAVGTPGRAIQRYGPRGGYVFLDGIRCDIRARVHTISGYSAHADQKDLVNFIRRMRRKPSEIRLVHGEGGARQRLAEALSSLGYVQGDGSSHLHLNSGGAVIKAYTPSPVSPERRESF